MAQKLLQGVFHIFCYLFPRLKETKGKQRIWSTGSNLFPDLIFLQFPFNDYVENHLGLPSSSLIRCALV